MPFIITDPCIETKDTACVDVCPVDCIHPRKDEPQFAEATMLYIHPDECVDCGARFSTLEQVIAEDGVLASRTSAGAFHAPMST